MQHISQSNDLHHPITERLLLKPVLYVGFPQFSDSTTPVLNVQQDQVLIIVDISLFVIHEHCEVFGKESPAWVL